LEGLVIVSGEPVVQPPPKVVREVKFGGDNGPRSERFAEDFLLKAQAVELFGFLDHFQNGVVDVLEVKHGLPFRLTFVDRAA
jgi:hypothetical protein